MKLMSQNNTLSISSNLGTPKEPLSKASLVFCRSFSFPNPPIISSMSTCQPTDEALSCKTLLSRTSKIHKNLRNWLKVCKIKKLFQYLFNNKPFYSYVLSCHKPFIWNEAEGDHVVIETHIWLAL